ncbi:MAG: arsenic resistance protein [Gammaproteobacteria bacterium]|nr:arsenic resistance protein [Gammaproteobacteria bacterium]
MNRAVLEKQQVWIYLAAIVCGLALGFSAPATELQFERVLWPVLAALLYVTFVQVPLLHLRAAFGDTRFLLAVTIGNFVVVPMAVWLLLQFLPTDPALRLGVLLVLLVPCTDWFITFAQLAGGNTARAMAVTPVNLVLQILLLPFYLWLMMPASDFGAAINADTLLPAAVLLVGLPLLAAACSEKWIEADAKRTIWRHRLGTLPVPLLALVVFLIAAIQADTVIQTGPLFLTLLPVFIGFLLCAAVIAKVLSTWLQLPDQNGITLAFSLSTRNSFVVLPFAMALPSGWEVTSIVIVFQSLIELLGMLIFLQWLPKTLFKQTSPTHLKPE